MLSRREAWPDEEVHTLGECALHKTRHSLWTEKSMHAHLEGNQKKIWHHRNNWDPFKRYIVRSSLANVSAKKHFVLHSEFMLKGHTAAIIQNFD